MGKTVPHQIFTVLKRADLPVIAENESINRLVAPISITGCPWWIGLRYPNTKSAEQAHSSQLFIIGDEARAKHGLIPMAFLLLSDKEPWEIHFNGSKTFNGGELRWLTEILEKIEATI